MAHSNNKNKTTAGINQPEKIVLGDERPILAEDQSEKESPTTTELVDSNTPVIKIAIRNLVEFVLRHGDIDSGFSGSSRAAEGIVLHKKIQNKYPSNAQAEVSMSYLFQREGLQLLVEGRADGLFEEDAGWLIDEIKSTMTPLDNISLTTYPLHFSQAAFYGYIFAMQNNLQAITIQLTYIHVETELVKMLSRKVEIEELKTHIEHIIDAYLPFARFTMDWKDLRQQSIKQAVFPFPEYREGQRQLAVTVYKSIQLEKKCFAMAPTGIGKTISTLFPSLKAMGEGLTSKLFYLTAKTSTRTVAHEAIIKLRTKNPSLHIKHTILTAKDKICFKEKTLCNPHYCEYAKGHFDRVNQALYEVICNEESYTRECIESYSLKHQLCPFEFGLDITLFSDIIIGDYNYLFDPSASLKRFFNDQKTDFTFLIDEAHNLVERGRDMYSAIFLKSQIMALKRACKNQLPKVEKALQGINQVFLDVKKDSEAYKYTLKEPPERLYHQLKRFCGEVEEYLIKSEKSELYELILQFYFDCLFGIKVIEFYDDHFVTYVEKINQEVTIKLFCIDPSNRLASYMKLGRSSILFSATLLPLPYYRSILGGEEDAYLLELGSPFDPKNRLLAIGNDVSTKYNQRDESIEKIAQYIHHTVSVQKGNYMVFFPSYKYLTQVFDKYLENYGDTGVFMQESGMSEEDKNSFLARFEKTSQRQIGFCVLGGSFSEGIDLVDDQLIGAIIVSPGLPLVCFERELITEFFQTRGKSGFDYAYLYPGMNKVLQAAGRVIRTETDQGVILLLDQRFTQQSYQKMFPKDWKQVDKLNSENVTEKVKEFWEKRQ